VRGDVALTARLALRPSGLAGLLAVVGGAAAIVAAFRPWYTAIAHLDMLGAADDRVVASLPGVPDLTVGWVALALGAAAVVLGLAIAVDRPPAWTRGALAVLAAGLAVLVVVAVTVLPDLDRVAGTDARALLAIRERLPDGVALDLRVGRGPGPWLAALGAVGVAIGAVGARER
jgi:hypothetical protein